MAERRMFTRKITDSDAFLELPSAAQALYFHLNQGADDDGFNNQISAAMFKAHASVDDLKILMLKNFVIRFENGVIVIKHWRMHNTLRKDRYKPTNFQEELSLLNVKDNGAYSLGCQMVAVDKYSIDKYSMDERERACARESQMLKENLNSFCQKFNIQIDTNSSYIAEMDFDKLSAAYDESKTFLQDRAFAKCLSWIVKYYDSIIAGKYKDKPISTKRADENPNAQIVSKWTAEAVNAAFAEFNEEI